VNSTYYPEFEKPIRPHEKYYPLGYKLMYNKEYPRPCWCFVGFAEEMSENLAFVWEEREREREREQLGLFFPSGVNFV